MGHFSYTVTKADVHNYWREFEAAQAARRAIRKETRMPVQKSMSDLAWQAVTSAAQALVVAKTFRNTSEAIDAMKAASHPAYAVYLASLDSRTAPPTTIRGDVTKVVKAAETVKLEKRRAVQVEINKLAAPYLREGMSEVEATQAVWKADYERGGDLYDRYRKASYATGSPADVPYDAPRVVPDKPAYAMAKQMARELKTNDVYGEYTDKNEIQMIDQVLRNNPELAEANRQESYYRG